MYPTNDVRRYIEPSVIKLHAVIKVNRDRVSWRFPIVTAAVRRTRITWSPSELAYAASMRQAYCKDPAIETVIWSRFSTSIKTANLSIFLTHLESFFICSVSRMFKACTVYKLPAAVLLEHWPLVLFTRSSADRWTDRRTYPQTHIQSNPRLFQTTRSITNTTATVIKARKNDELCTTEKDRRE